jgi:hypothetical protein
MAQTPEKKVKDWVCKWLDKTYPDHYRYMPVPTGFGRRGVADIVCSIKGKWVSIEVKTDKGKPTKLQEIDQSKVIASGGVAIIIYGKDQNALDELYEVL